jgi:tetratricopeptide (TPR) repeat protein
MAPAPPLSAIEAFELSPETQTPPSEMQGGIASTGEMEEVDLSDEWEAMVQEVVEPPASPIVEASTLPPPAEPVIAALQTVETIDIESAAEPGAPEAPEATEVLSAEPEIYEITEDVAEEQPAPAEPFEFINASVAEASSGAELTGEGADFELELAPRDSETSDKGASTTEDFIDELALEVEGMEPPAPVNGDGAHHFAAEPPLPETAPTVESLNQLSEVFQEFRSELGELGEEDEDLETHYNLGIAYREMGLLDEAIGEFQKVAKAVQKGKPFRYAMNCAVLLALSFADKGEPKIAALWYKRALELPGLEQETILALRYDLGISLENAGEPDEALDCFRQVYAMNIDYRDVSDRIATLQHH